MFLPLRIQQFFGKAKRKTPPEVNLDHYASYLKPLPGKLLKGFQLDIDYKNGEGNWLSYRTPDNRDQEILDTIGGYGANILGHKNRELMHSLTEALTHGPPSNLQGSIRASAIRLGEKLSSLLEEETKEGPWVTHLSNSGTEAVEAALKHSLLYFSHKMKNLSYSIQEAHNKVEKFLQEGTESSIAEIFRRMVEAVEPSLSFLPMQVRKSLVQQKGPREFLHVLSRYNKNLLSQAPYFVSIEGGFHGKTLGSLKVTKRGYGESFYVNQDLPIKSILLPRQNLAKASRLLSGKKRMLVTVEFDRDKDKEKGKEVTISFKTVPFSPLCCVILEPIQGEAGIYEIPKDLVELIKDQSTADDFLVVFDEIQSGLYRTGKLTSGFHTGQAADIYCFSKGLGGGLVKIGATAILSHKYIQEFGLLHTSTFAEDDLSSTIGLKVLDILTGGNSPVRNGQKMGVYLKRKLQALKEKYPHILKEIRGQGLLLAIEFSPSLRTSCFEFKVFCDGGMIGYLFSSALLHKNHLRIAPTLSHPYCLRMEPSLYLNESEANFIIKAMGDLLKAIDQLDMKYFFSHIYPNQNIGKPGLISKGTIHYKKGKRPMAVFLNHPIDVRDIGNTMTSHKKIGSSVLFEKFKSAHEISTFDITYRGTIVDAEGREVELVLLSFPLPSEEILHIFKSQNRSMLIEKVQDAIHYAKSLGANTVGLGQFTSIVTKNGFYLDPMGMTLTTGNAYTCALSLEATLREAEIHHLTPQDTRIACIGAPGNIVSVTASLLTNHCHHLSLVYHTSLENSDKLRNSVSLLLRDIVQSEALAPCARGLKEALIARGFPQNHQELLEFMNQESVKKHLSIESHLERLKEAHIIVTGANTAHPFIEGRHLREGVIVVDMAVPRNVSDEVVRARPDITYILGGIAYLPQTKGGQAIEADFFPLARGEVYACMAETITLSFAQEFAGHGEKLHIGPINRAQVERIRGLAGQVGFSLARNKTQASY